MARTYLNAHLIWPDFLYVLKNMSSKNRQVKVCSISKKLPQKILAFFFYFFSPRIEVEQLSYT